VTLLGQHHAAAILGQDGQHAELAAGIAQRHIQRGGRRQRVGAQTGLAPVIGDPLRHRQVRTP